jgi:hypothetical protein
MDPAGRCSASSRFVFERVTAIGDAAIARRREVDSTRCPIGSND